MATPQENARAAERDRGLRAVSRWTWAAGLGGFGLTGAIALLAASSFAGHQTAAAAATAAPSTPEATAAPSASVDSTNPDNSVPAQPQQAPQDSLGGSNQPPAAVSGGS